MRTRCCGTDRLAPPPPSRPRCCSIHTYSGRCYLHSTTGSPPPASTGRHGGPRALHNREPAGSVCVGTAVLQTPPPPPPPPPQPSSSLLPPDECSATCVQYERQAGSWQRSSKSGHPSAATSRTATSPGWNASDVTLSASCARGVSCAVGFVGPQPHRAVPGRGAGRKAPHEENAMAVMGSAWGANRRRRCSAAHQNAAAAKGGRRGGIHRRRWWPAGCRRVSATCRSWRRSAAVAFVGGKVLLQHCERQACAPV